MPYLSTHSSSCIDFAIQRVFCLALACYVGHARVLPLELGLICTVMLICCSCVFQCTLHDCCYGPLVDSVKQYPLSRLSNGFEWRTCVKHIYCFCFFLLEEVFECFFLLLRWFVSAYLMYIGYPSTKHEDGIYRYWCRGSWKRRVMAEGEIAG